ncbi:hypothetical protein SPRG_12986 [Saprolegnia parasitica CBS 223.65]|uniref:Ion transport domain-containing protein n=1 Tax=Saprolegnia parasitica (strain CBS 223.65) TaxID=695850 RepID=A0A067BQ68_SAPPC|nr:hypothetical protein SPRG_12986 [Saprolegnia parasitica CBS 223.65]KDO20629.1 hypothetical protein SPRG_12986 [Saprolegnia parasitica CBS 223.65]|eukprot:XP_012208683.1 hypothetical protein SPRG_12986 [Saprolegnia parasitica CBS 223.65]
MRIAAAEPEPDGENASTVVHVLHSARALAGAATRIQAWYQLFRRRTSFAVVREKYLQLLATIGDDHVGVLRKWYCIYLQCRRPQARRASTAHAASWEVVSVATMRRTLQPLPPNASEEVLYAFLEALPSRWLVVDWTHLDDMARHGGEEEDDDDNDDDEMRPQDTLLHIVVRRCSNVSRACLDLFQHNDSTSLQHLGAHDQSIVHAAAEGGHLRTLQALLVAGGDMRATDIVGATPLHLAAANGHVAIVQYLAEMMHMPLDVTTQSGETPLHFAATHNHTSVVGYLLSQKCNLNAVTTTQFCSSLHYAAARGHLDVVKQLVMAHADVLPNAVGNTILHVAAETNDTAILAYLSSLPAMVHFATAANNRGYSPLHVAAVHGAKDAYVLLNRNPWRSKPPLGLITDYEGLFPFALLVQSDGITTEDAVGLYLPRHAGSDDVPMWHACVFQQVLHTAPDFAWAVLDAYAIAATNHVGAPALTMPKLDEMYGADIESSLLGMVLDCVDDASKSHRSVLLRLLQHPIPSRILRVKWKSFGRRIYYMQLFGAALLLATLTIGIAMARPAPRTPTTSANATQPAATFYLSLFLWIDFVLVSIAGMLISYAYERVLQYVRHGVIRFLRVTKAAVTSPRFFATSRHLETKGPKKGGYVRRRLKELLLRHCVSPTTPSTALVNNVLAIGLLTVTTSIAGWLTLCVLFGLGSATDASPRTTFLSLNLAVQWLATLYMLAWEALEWYGAPRRYATSIWNFVQVVVFCTLLLLPLSAASDETHGTLLAPLVLLSYLNFLELLRFHDWTGPMISMVHYMLRDVRNFLVLYAVFQMGLTCAYYALLQGQLGFATFSEAFVSTYLIMFGLGNADVMLRSAPYPQQYVLTVCFMLHFLVVVIVLLNALIATMTKSTDAILDQVQDQVACNRARTILRAEVTVPHRIRTSLWNRLKARVTKRGDSYLFKPTTVPKTAVEATEDPGNKDDSAAMQALETRLVQCVDTIESLRRAQEDMEARLLAESAKTQDALAALTALLAQPRARKLKLTDVEAR